MARNGSKTAKSEVTFSFQVYPVMKFHLLTQLSHWCREISIQEGVKAETRV